MQTDRFVSGLAGVFAVLTATVVGVGIWFGEPVVLVVALPLGIAAFIFWYQSSGRLAARVMRRGRAARRRSKPRGGAGQGSRRHGDQGPRGAGGRWTYTDEENQAAGRRQAPGMSPREASRYLGVPSGADPDEIQRAYRERVKDVHPDRGGDEEEFRKATEAYETLQR